MSAGAYRPDIDGLRAVAVLAVILFHADIGFVSGGFVGVDVFFVISGYLITRLIRDEMETGRFSWRRFYLRRARRLLPALFVTVALTFLAGAWLLTPQHLVQLGRSSLSALTFVANFEFWNQSGYFDGDATFKPLLHTWSLAVEEQFYMLWPLLLFGLLALRGRWLAPAVLLLASIVSVAASEIWLRIDPAFAFYMLPFRLFELGIGALCVWAGTWRPRPALAEAMVVAGLVLILVPMLVYDDFSLFPGWRALPPCLGAALIVLAGAQARFAARLLNNRPAVWIGQISYSLYLVHWPLLVYFWYIKLRDAEPLETVALIALAIGMAALMQRYVERPFRYPPQADRVRANRRFVVACLALAAALAVPAAHVVQTGGWYGRYTEPVAQALRSSLLDRWAAGNTLHERHDAPFPHPERPSALIIGDSHAQDLFYALELAGTRYWLKHLDMRANCQPVIGEREIRGTLRFESQAEACNERFKSYLESPEMAAADAVILMAQWRTKGAERIVETIDAIRAHTDAQIIVFGPKVSYRNLPVLLARHGRLEGFADFANNHQKLGRVLNSARLLVRNMEHAPALFVNTYTLYCDGMNCPVLTPDGMLTVRDNAHWTAPGAKYFGELLKFSDEPAASLLFDRADVD